MTSHSAELFTRLQRAGGLLLVAGLLTAASACMGQAQIGTGFIYDEPVAYVGRPPARYWHYPHRYYLGHPAYLIGGRWYYSTPRGWAVFRREPAELRRYREGRSQEAARRRPSWPGYLQPHRRDRVRPRPRNERGLTAPTEQRRRRYPE